jgi:hypothetical protein
VSVSCFPSLPFARAGRAGIVSLYQVLCGLCKRRGGEFAAAERDDPVEAAALRQVLSAGLEPERPPHIVARVDS